MTIQSNATSQNQTIKYSFAVTFIFCLIVIVLRDPQSAISPPVRLEDARDMLSFYWRNDDPSAIFRFYAGYVSVFPNFIGYISGNISGILSIYLLHWAPLVLASLSFSIICRKDVNIMEMTDQQKTITAIALSLVPMSNYALLTTATYFLWSMIIASTLLIVGWRPKPGPSAILLFLFVALTSMSHPLFILLTPFIAIRVIVSDNHFERYGFLCIILISFAYLFTLVDLSGSGKGADQGIIGLLVEAMRSFASRAVAEPLMSSQMRAEFVYRGLIDGTVAFGLLVMLGIGVFIARRRHLMSQRQIWQLAALALLAALFTSASTATGRTNIEESWGQRYFYPSAFFVMLILIWCAFQALSSAPRSVRSAALALVAGWLVSINYLDAHYYQSSAQDRMTTYRLVTEADQLSHQGAPYCVRNDRDLWIIRLAENWAPENDCTVINQ